MRRPVQTPRRGVSASSLPPPSASPFPACPEDALLAPVAYHNSRGEPFETPLAEISAHVVSHGAYHRGQIAALLRAAGLAPPPTDRIAYARLPEAER